MGRLLLLFIVVPAVELALLIEIGRRIGTGATIGLILVTGALGAVLARRQGLRVIREVQQSLAAGELPASPLLDGLLIAIASALLITPGVLTDFVGFLLLVPGFRSHLKRRLRRAFEGAVASERIHVEMYGPGASGPPFGAPGTRPGRGPIIDVTPKADDDDHGP